MAGQSAKKQVQTNVKVLKEIHLITWVSFTLFFITNFIFHRPASSKPFVIFYIPALISLFILEKTGRPTYDSAGRAVSAGKDLTQSGLTEYFFDIIYVTVILNLLAFLFGSNKVWWLYLVVPGFACYKLYGVFNAGRQLLGMGKKQGGEDEQAAQEPVKSKRQQKREARGDKQKVRYR